MEKADIKRELQSMDDYEFEHLVADLWESDGWDTTVSQASNDDGIDVTAVKEAPFNRKELIQAKRYSNGTNVGGPAIQQYASLRHQESGVDSVAVVTTSGFTLSAERLADNLNVKLIDGDDLANWISSSNEDVMADHIANSGSSVVALGNDTIWTELDLAEEIVDYPANQSDESIRKMENLRKLFEKNLEINKGGQFIDTYFEFEGDISTHYQFHLGCHNSTGLSEKGADNIRSIADEEGLEIPEDEEFDAGFWIEVETNTRKNDLCNGYYDVWIAIRILYEGYGIEFEDVLKAENVYSSSKFDWDEIPASNDESSDEEINSIQPEELAESALDDSVTAERLTHIGTGNRIENYVHDKPIIEYMSEREQPQYFFFNRKSGVEIGEKQINAGWSSNYRNSLLVTDEGIHFFVGQESGDFHEFLPYDSLKDVEARTGIMKNRLIFESVNKSYDFKTTPDANEVEEAAKYISDQLQ